MAAVLVRGPGSVISHRSAAALHRLLPHPEPETNVEIAGYEVDFLWRPQRLVVEVDGFAFHSSPVQFERDRRKDSRLAAAGLRAVRVTWRQLTSEPEAVLVRLAQALVQGLRNIG